MKTEPISDSAMAPEGPESEPPELRDAIFDATGDVHADPDALEQTLRSLLAVYPQALVGAMTSAGIYVEMPDSSPSASSRCSKVARASTSSAPRIVKRFSRTGTAR